MQNSVNQTLWAQHKFVKLSKYRIRNTSTGERGVSSSFLRPDWLSMYETLMSSHSKVQCSPTLSPFLSPSLYIKLLHTWTLTCFFCKTHYLNETCHPNTHKYAQSKCLSVCCFDKSKICLVLVVVWWCHFLHFWGFGENDWPFVPRLRFFLGFFF